MKKPLFETKKTDSNVLQIKIKGRPNKNWESWFLLRSDAHHDNPKADNKLEEKHLKEAKEKGAGILDLGDNFCAMQGKYDPRSAKSSIKPEHQVDNYYDALVSTNADFLEPYSHLFINMGRGNHEEAVIKRHEIDLTQRLISVLNDRTGSQIHCLGYTGWVQFKFDYGRNISRTLWYTHGYGGGGPVTEDMIQSSRQRVYIDSCDIMCSGHVHRSWVQEYVKHRTTIAGKLEKRIGYYVKIPTYKDSYGDGSKGFEASKGMGPRPTGAYWIRFTYSRLYGIETQIIKAN